MGPLDFGYDKTVLASISQDIKEVMDLGAELAIVVGAGNIARGKDLMPLGIDKASADYVGMLGTVMNALILKNTLQSIGLKANIMSAINIDKICNPYMPTKAIECLQRKEIVIFAAGTGNPFFTTDTAAVLRAVEMKCDFLLKGTQVDGVYSKDPKKHQDAVRFDRVSYEYLITNNLDVMDITSLVLARDNKLAIKVFPIASKGAFAKTLTNQGKFTLISKDEQP